MADRALFAAQVAHYRIVERIGVGGMGEVYRAEDTRLRREVAIKTLRREVAADPARRERFRREALAAAALNHPNVVTIYAVDEYMGTPFLVMELIDGKSLGELIPPEGLSAASALAMATDLAAALAAAHAAGITHRDLKPDNVMQTREGRLKVLDFGLAKVAERRVDDVVPRTAPGDETVDATQLDLEIAADELTTVGQVVGTAAYMSPEQALGLPVEPASDIFSFGVLLHQMLTGQRPFVGASAREVLANVLHQPIPSLPAATPAPLARVVSRCVTKEVKGRYADGGVLAKALGELEVLAPAGSSSALREGAPEGGVAVLPFTARGGGEEGEWMCEGMTESLIHSLARLRGVRVLSHSAVRALEQNGAPEDLGAQLGVDRLVVGSLTFRGSRLRLNVELVEVADGSQVWGQRYDRELTDAMGVEADLTEQIVRHVGRELSSSGGAAGALAATNPQAYLLYLKSKPLIVGSAVQMKKASEFLEQAVALDPEYALAHATLSSCYTFQAMHGVRHAAEAQTRARQSMSRALALAPNLAETQAAAGMVQCNFDWAWDAAEASFRRAIELEPGRDLPRLEYSEFLSGVGRYEEALEAAARAREVDPVSPNSDHLMGYACLLLGRLDDGIAHFRAALSQHPNWTWGYVKLARIQAEAELYDEAVATAETAERALLDGGSPLARGWIGLVYGLAGQSDRARDQLRKIEARSDVSVDPVARAFVYYSLGERERVLELLEESYRTRSPLAPNMKSLDPLMRRLRLGDEPRFRALLEAMDLPV